VGRKSDIYPLSVNIVEISIAKFIGFPKIMHVHLIKNIFPLLQLQVVQRSLKRKVTNRLNPEDHGILIKYYGSKKEGKEGPETFLIK
jgi:hypothetical protein